jgi:hypothetical protein
VLAAAGQSSKKETTVPQSQCAWKGFPYGAGRLPKPEAAFRSGAGISVLGAMRFELQWRDREKPKNHE